MVVEVSTLVYTNDVNLVKADPMRNLDKEKKESTWKIYGGQQSNNEE